MTKIKYYYQRVFDFMLLLTRVIITLIGGSILFIILRFLAGGVIEIIQN